MRTKRPIAFAAALALTTTQPAQAQDEAEGPPTPEAAAGGSDQGLARQLSNPTRRSDRLAPRCRSVPASVRGLALSHPTHAARGARQGPV